jgi:rare lipoprotein A
MKNPVLFVLFAVILAAVAYKAVESQGIPIKPAKIRLTVTVENPFLIHKVRKGQSLWRIARMYGDTIKEIERRNNLPTSIVRVGQNLKIVPRIRPAVASWYGAPFHGRKMANGKRYDMFKPLAAHKHLPLGRRIWVLYPETGKSIILSIADRGPYIKGRDIDLSLGAARLLGMVETGVDEVFYRVIR